MSSLHIPIHSSKEKENLKLEASIKFTFKLKDIMGQKEFKDDDTLIGIRFDLVLNDVESGIKRHAVFPKFAGKNDGLFLNLFLGSENNMLNKYNEVCEDCKTMVFYYKEIQERLKQQKENSL